MITFKQYLTEALTPEQAKHYKKYKMTADARKKTNVIFPRGVDSIREELKQDPVEKSDTHKAVEQHIGQEIDIPHYVSGRTNPNEKGQQIRLGKVIKDPALLQKFSVDPSRAGGRSGASQGYVTIHRGLQVAGQTNPEPTECNPSGHSWAGPGGSCKNIESGGQRARLRHEIQQGTVVMFGHDPSGKEIYRATLQPHHSGEHTIYTVNSQYGNKHPAFVAHAHDVAARLTSKGAPKTATYRIAPYVYDDSGVGRAYHPDAPSEFIKNKYYENVANSNLAASMHRNLPPEVIDKDIELTYNKKRVKGDPHGYEREAAADRLYNVVSGDSPAINESHITKMIAKEKARSDGPDGEWLDELIGHHKFSKEHIEQILAYPRGYQSIREKAIDHPKLTKDIALNVINNPREHKRIRALALSHPGIDEAILKHHAGDKEPLVAYAAASNPKLKSPEHLDEIAKSPKYGMVSKMGLMVNPNSTGSHVTDVINHIENNTSGNANHKYDAGAALFTALRHPQVTPEHIASVFGSRKISKLIEHPGADNGVFAEMFPHWKPEHLMALVQHAHMPRHVAEFLQHPAANKAVIKAALKHPKEEAREAAEEARDYGHPDIDMWTEPTSQYLPTYNARHHDPDEED